MRKLKKYFLTINENDKLLLKTQRKTLSKEGKDKRWKKARERYQNFTEKEEKKHLYHREWHKNPSEEQQKKLLKYRRNYYITTINNCINQ